MRFGVLLLIAGCGRLGFDPSARTGDATPAIPGLVARYTMDDDPADGTVLDTSAHGRDAHCIVDTTCPTIAPGKRGNALQFDGATQLLRITDHPSFHNPQSFTVAAWVFLDMAVDSHVAVGKTYEGGIENSFNLFLNTDGTCMEWFQESGPALRCTVGSNLLGRWSHMMQIWDGSEMVLYLDGIRAVSASFSETILFDGHDVTIGADEDDGTAKVFWPGRIDEVHIFDRALAVDEIAELSAP